MANESRFISWKLIRSHHRVPIFLSTRNNNTHGYNERLILPGHFYDRPRNNSESRNPSLSSIDHRDRASIRKNLSLSINHFSCWRNLPIIDKNRSNFESNGWYIIDVHIYIDMIHWKGRREKKRGEGKKMGECGEWRNWSSLDNERQIWKWSNFHRSNLLPTSPTSPRSNNISRFSPNRAEPRESSPPSFSIIRDNPISGNIIFCTWGGGRKLCRGWARRPFFNEVTRKLGRFQTFDSRDSSPSSSF